MKSFYYNLSGGLNTAATKTDLGLEAKRIYWSEAKNVEIYKNKGITRQNGNTLVVESPDKTPITGIFGYDIDDKALLLFNTADGNVYFYDINTGKTKLVYEKLTDTKNVCYTRFLYGIIISNGVDDMLYFTHSPEPKVVKCNAKSAAGRPIRATAVAAYKSRLWAACGAAIYFSALGRYDDWSTPEDAGYINNFLADIDEITALAPYKDYLAIYKKDATFLLSGNSPEDFAVERFADRGALCQTLVTNADNRQYFFNDGVFCLEQVGILSQMSLGSDISLCIRPEITDRSLKPQYNGVVINYETKGQIWFFIPRSNESYINRVLIFDYINSAWTQRVIPQPITCATYVNGMIYTGSEEGEILLEDFGASFNGKPIEFSWKSPFFAVGEPNARKCVDEFYLLLDESIDNSFKYSTYRNYDSIVQDDIIAVETMDSAFLVWDTGKSLWADDNISYIWPQLTEGSYKVEITQSNVSVQICIEGHDLGQNFALTGLEFREVYYD